MLKSILFFDEITLWWDKAEFSRKADLYKFYLDTRYVGDTTKTHCTFSCLDADKEYTVRIEAFVKGSLVTAKEYSYKTKPSKKRIDATLPPYNAVGDGKTLNTKALQTAIDALGEDEYLYIPKGVFLTGALDLKSGVEIYLEEGAVLQGSQSREDYLPKIWSRFEGAELECYRSLLNLGVLDHNNYGYTCENVSLRGKGTIFGGGRPLATDIIEYERVQLKEFMEKNADYVKTCENLNTIPGRARGRLINMSNCKNIVLSGLTMGYGPSWNIHFVYSKDIITYGCVVCSNKQEDSEGNIIREGVWNGDGWDPDSSEDCVVFDTVFRTGDDCIAIKSGKNPEGNKVNRPTKNVYIFDCVMEDGHSVSIGSEMSGGVENVQIWDSDLTDCYCGVQVKGTKKRGGYVKGLCVFDSVIPAVFVRSVKYNDDGEGFDVPPVFSGYRFENLDIMGSLQHGGQKIKDYVCLCGFDEEGYHLTDVSFDNIRIFDAEEAIALKLQYTDNLSWNNVSYVNSEK
jgi:polygalacturonase